MSTYAGPSSGGGVPASERPGSGADSETGAYSRQCRVVIGDAHPLVLEGLSHLLSSESALEIVERCTTGASLLDSIRHHHPDLSLVDLRLQEPDGLEVLRSIKQEALVERQ